MHGNVIRSLEGWNQLCHAIQHSRNSQLVGMGGVLAFNLLWRGRPSPLPVSFSIPIPIPRAGLCRVRPRPVFRSVPRAPPTGVPVPLSPPRPVSRPGTGVRVPVGPLVSLVRGRPGVPTALMPISTRKGE